MRLLELIEDLNISTEDDHHTGEIPIGDSILVIRVQQNGEWVALGAFLGDEQVGELTVDEGEIMWIHVEPAFRRKGLGGIMIDYLKKLGYDVEHSESLTEMGKMFVGGLKSKDEKIVESFDSKPIPFKFDSSSDKSYIYSFVIDGIEFMVTLQNSPVSEVSLTRLSGFEKPKDPKIHRQIFITCAHIMKDFLSRYKDDFLGFIITAKGVRGEIYKRAVPLMARFLGMEPYVTDGRITTIQFYKPGVLDRRIDESISVNYNFNSMDGFWIDERGNILEVNHDEEIHHTDIASDELGIDIYDEDGNIDDYLTDHVQEMAINQEWVRVTTIWHQENPSSPLIIDFGRPSRRAVYTLLRWVIAAPDHIRYELAGNHGTDYGNSLDKAQLINAIEEDIGPVFKEIASRTFRESITEISQKPWLRVTPTMISQAKDIKAQVIVDMPAWQFLRLTTRDEEHLRVIHDQAKRLRDYNRWGKAGDNSGYRDRLNHGKSKDDDDYQWGTIHMPWLDISLVDERDEGGDYFGVVVGHEGRHRAAASIRDGNGMMRVALRLIPEDDFTGSRRYAMTHADVPPVVHNQYENDEEITTERWKVVQGDMQAGVRRSGQ